MKEALIVGLVVIVITAIATPLIMMGWGSSDGGLGLTTPTPTPQYIVLTPTPTAQGAPQQVGSARPQATPTGEPPTPSAPRPTDGVTLPVIVEMDTGDSVSFILRDGSRRAVTLKGTRLAFASGGVTVWATATVEVSGAGLPAQSAEIPAAYFRSPTVLNGVRVYVAITQEFNDGALRDQGGTAKAARLVLSDAQYPLTTTALYRWPFEGVLWQEGSNTTYWQGLQGERGALFHNGSLDIGIPRQTPIRAWAGGTLAAEDRGYDWAVWLNNADDGQSGLGGHRLLHLADVDRTKIGSRVAPGDYVGVSGGSVNRSGQIEWWHVSTMGGFEWGPMMAEWYMARASPAALSYIKDWLVAGPFGNLDDSTRLTRDYLGNEASVQPVPDGAAGNGIAWNLWDNVVPGVVSVGDAVDPYPFSGWAWVNGNYPNSAAYFATYVYSGTRHLVVLNIGSSDAARVWVDDRLVFNTYDYVADGTPGVGRTIIVDQYKPEVELRAGWNRLLVKVAQRDGSPRSWQFSLRISDKAGNPIPVLVTSPVKQLPGASPATVQPGADADDGSHPRPRQSPTPVFAATPVPATAVRPTPTPTWTPIPTRAPTPTATRVAPTATAGSNVWTPLARTPLQVGAGGALTTDGRFLYAVAGQGLSVFWRFDPAANAWSSLANLPASLGPGASLAFAKGFVYALRGNQTRDLYRYDPAADRWMLLTQAPQNIGWGGTIVWDGQDSLYVLRGGGVAGGITGELWWYDIPSGFWTTMPSPPSPVNQGGGLAFVNGFFYGFRGGETADFWMFDPGTLWWTQLIPAPDVVGAGGAVAHREKDDYVYAFRGDLSRTFWRYHIFKNTWETLAEAPLEVGEGGALTVLGGEIYALRGGLSTDLWRYSTPKVSTWAPDQPQPSPPAGFAPQPTETPVPQSSGPSPQPTQTPTSQPTAQPSPTPTPQPTPQPTPAPSPQPTAHPTSTPCTPIPLIRVCP